MPHKTPRMLARTIKVLRERRKSMSLTALATEFGVKHNTVSNWETRAVSLTYKNLDLYQHYFGAPNGILLCISHIAAMARDRGTHPDARVRQRERRKLQIMGKYLKNLSERVLEETRRGELDAYSGVLHNDPESWDLLIHDLMLATQRGVRAADAKVFEDHERVADIREGR